MNKILLLFLLTSCFFVHAQMQDLAKLASGELLGFNALFDDQDNLFGVYFNIRLWKNR
ncbi:MAG: hypothetical protein ACK5MD_07415 [Flavobacteriales bacterium]